LQTADRGRTPSYTIFPKPDYFFDSTFPRCAASTNPAADCVAQFARFAYDHGYYSPDIDIIWSGVVGPGVAHKGLVGPNPQQGPTATAAGQNGSPELTVPKASKGLWVEEADIRPTLLALVGLHDDYLSDGGVVTQILSHRPHGNPFEALELLAAVYRQLNSCVGAFATAALQADSVALASASAGDETFNRIQTRLTQLADQRDALAQQIKVTLSEAGDGRGRLDHKAIAAEIFRAVVLLDQMGDLAESLGAHSA
jgi:hypothetical protein